MEDADAQELEEWTTRLVEKFKHCPTAQRGKRPAKRRPRTPISSSTATPHYASVSPSAIDDTLYDAFGQRQVSTIFTQLNQYHVVLEVAAPFPAESRRSDKYLRQIEHGQRFRSPRFSHFESGTLHAGHQPSGPISGRDYLLQPRPGVRWATRPKRLTQLRRKWTSVPALSQLPRNRGSLPGLIERTHADSGRPYHGLHRAGRAL